MKNIYVTTEWAERFSAGAEHHAQEVLGARLTDRGAVFRVWAPEAAGVSVAGEFNDWDASANPMIRLEAGIWEAEIAQAKLLDRYKYVIRTSDGRELWKADPYAYYSEHRPSSASRIFELGGFGWSDEKWLERRRTRKVYENALNIYEVHLGSWRAPEDGGPVTYAWLEKTLIPYVKSLGFTHIELMPLTEYPYDASWGYQCTGYFASTARYGDPHDLMKFINACHKANLGVIMDWVPAHFPKDSHGLAEFDGTRLYEYADQAKGENLSWGTRIFDFGRGQVRSFLVSSALFWLEVFHIDGLRVDAVASMLYLDYDKRDGQWSANIYGGNENLEAVEFLRILSTAAFAEDDSILLIAEESTAWPQVTMPTDTGGLGFNLKWNMGWMNDMLAYIKTDPYFRAGCHNNLTFSFFYAFSENYLLPLSHDEVVHMKGSLYGKMPGSTEMKLAGMRSFWAYMLAHPGKKLLFMGAELGQEAEWDFASQLRWDERENPEKARLHEFFRAANRFYKRQKTLWELDFDQAGFKWICPDESMRNIVGFQRFCGSGKGLIIACNFSGVNATDFRMGMPKAGEYEVLFSTDEIEYGGSGQITAGSLVRTENIPQHGHGQSALLPMPALSVVFMKYARKGRKAEQDKEVDSLPKRKK